MKAEYVGKLGIPTAVDRVIQQAIAQVLMPIYEPKFAETSYGFRSKRSWLGELLQIGRHGNVPPEH